VVNVDFREARNHTPTLCALGQPGDVAYSQEEDYSVKKQKSAKKLSLNKETLRQLQPEEVEQAAGAWTSWNSQCTPTCGDNSCLGVCSLNCSFLACDQDAAKG
jgi:hypothetical protein